ncbi:MAG: hypothetical protein EOO45_05910 [Flavobacterium sp.]|nr:MAG: hypothetical protein EOO45_05910 [Flavobacterium sp.]
MKKVLSLIVLLLFSGVYAQSKNCNCNQALEELIRKIESEYPGFSFKTKDISAYSDFKGNLLQKSKKANSNACPAILKSYADYFKDPHLWAGANGAPFSVSTTSGSVESIDINLQEFRDFVEKSTDKYEGIWSNDTYTFGIKKTNAKQYTGFIIESKYKEWKPGDIKFKLYANGTFEYALLDRTIETGDYKLPDENILHLEDVSVALVRRLPKPTLNEQQIAEKLNELNGFYFKRLSSKTAILKLGSFDYPHLKTIDSLIESNKILLESENLIIDLRGNPGGSTTAYQKLLPYISGKAIRNTGTEFLSSKTYIGNLESYKKTIDKNISTTALDEKINLLKSNLGKYVNFSISGETEVSVENIEMAAKSPKQIIFLANGLTGSSAEYFLFIAKQSRKVKIFGKPSYGALDYGNAYLNNLECSGYQVFMPTYRALRLPDYPIDNIGIQPDIYMDNSIRDWVTFAIDYLEN